MAKGKKNDILLSTLEEIKQTSDDDDIPAREPVSEPEKKPATKGPRSRNDAGSLLDNLLSDAKEEADREVAELTRSADERARQQREQRRLEEERKKAEYDRKIREEADRRMNLIRKKEEEKRRQEEAVRQREEARKLREQRAIEQARAARKRKATLLSLLVITILSSGAFALYYFWFDESGAGSPPPKSHSVSKWKARNHDLSLPPIVKDPHARPVEIPTKPETFTSIDGPVSVALDLPEKIDADTLQRKSIPDPEPGVSPDADKARKKIARTFRTRRPTSSGRGSDDDGDGGSLNINTSVFND